jgi:alkylation response protein AidB-like acyl-CoA dehydrogenase
MSFVLTEEQVSLQRAARELAQSRLPITHLRSLRDSDDAVGFSRERWQEMASLGWPGIVLPEEHGGLGLGYAELGIVLQSLGRTLAPHPFLSTIVLAGTALLLGGSEAQRKDLLPAICAGERILAFAHEEKTHHAPHHVTTRAVETKDGFRLDGEKSFVLDGHVADALVVVARTSGAVDARDGITLFLLKRTAPGVRTQRLRVVDSRNAARIQLSAVEVRRADVIGEIGGGADLLEPALDRATIALCAEMLGGAEEAFERTIAYLKTRHQFGVPIGSFQALKHRAAHMFCELELARSIVLEALRAIDGSRRDVPTLASAAKARLSDVFLLIANEAIQMHGGVGVTDELDIGFFLKRARVAQATFGDASYHRDRFARLSGF